MKKIKICYKEKMSKRPVPIGDIGGRINVLPKDVRLLIEPFSEREYLRVRKFAEAIVRKIVPYIVNPKHINYDTLIDDVAEILAFRIGLNLDEFLRNYGNFPISRFDVYIDTMINGNPIKLRGDIAKLFVAPETYNYNETNFDHRMRQTSAIIVTTFPYKDFYNYVASLFLDAGYKGNSLDEIIQNYKTS